MDHNLQELYTITVRNRYDELSKPENNISESYDNFIKANIEAASLLIPKKKKKDSKDISKDVRIIVARKRVQDAFLEFSITSSSANEIQLQNMKEELRQIYTAIHEEELDTMIQQIETCNTNYKHGESWRLINSITGRKSSKFGLIKGNSKEERLNLWYKHFSYLLGKESDSEALKESESIPVIFRDLDINDGPFTPQELEKVKKGLSNGKALGPDNISSEVLKLCNFDEIILSFANKLIIDGIKPEMWARLDLLPIPKSGDLSNTGNYRGISLTSVVAKMVNKMILNRIQPRIDPLLRKNQNGFRPGRSTIAHILAIRRLIEGDQRNNRTAVITFVDFKKAFDSVNRGKMMNILEAYGVPPNLLKAIKVMYEGTKAKVITSDGETDYFNISTGVLQGDTLAPFLFAIFLDYALRKAIEGKEEELGFHLSRRRSRRISPIVLTDLDFVDDIALISQEIDSAQRLLTNVEVETKNVGLCLYAKKTEVQSYNIINLLACTHYLAISSKKLIILDIWMHEQKVVKRISR